MRSNPRLLCLNIMASVMMIAFLNINTTLKADDQAENNRPVVKILSPKGSQIVDSSIPVNYEISVTDKEDGDSKYDEINAKEVLLEVRTLTTKAKVQSLVNGPVQPDAAGLAVIRASNCFNCHSFNAKGIGPSFHDIGLRYPATAVNIDSLSKHVKLGSAGIWGKEAMPTHPELTAAQTKAAVQWLLKVAKDKQLNYYVGLQGSFKIEVPKPGTKGIYLLTASYTDHGLKTSPQKELKGQDVMILYGK